MKTSILTVLAGFCLTATAAAAQTPVETPRAMPMIRVGPLQGTLGTATFMNLLGHSIQHAVVLGCELTHVGVRFDLHTTRKISAATMLLHLG